MLNAYMTNDFNELQEKIDELRSFEGLPLFQVTKDNFNYVFEYLFSKDFDFYYEYQFFMLKIVESLILPFKSQDNIYVFKSGNICNSIKKELKYNSSLKTINKIIQENSIDEFIEFIIETHLLVKLEYKKYYFNADYIYDSVRIHYGLKLNPYLIYSSSATIAKKLKVKNDSVEKFKQMIKEYNAINKDFENRKDPFN